MAVATPLIYYNNNGSGNVNLTGGQQVSVACSTLMTVGLQNTTGVNFVTYQIRGPGTIYWSGEATVYAPTPNFAWTFQLPATPTLYTITVVSSDGQNVASTQNFFLALTNISGNIPTGTGVFHITAGVADATASHGTANQYLQENAAATNQAWVTLQGDVSPGANGVIDVVGIQGQTIGGTASVQNQTLLYSGSGTYSWGLISLASGVTGILPVANGGTNAATLTAHSVLLGEGTSTVGFAGPNATSGLPLLSQGSSTDPTFAALSLSGSSITGVLPVPHGGTNAATLTPFSLLAGAGANTVTFVGPNAATGANALALLSAGAGANPNFGALNLGGSGTVTGVLPYTAGGTGLSTIAANTYVLTIVNNAPAWATAAPSGTIPVTQGGTGLTTLTAHAVLLGEGTSNVGFTGPDSVSGVPLLSQGASADPAFAALSLAGSGITGLLPVGNIAHGTTGQVFVESASAPAWTTPSGDVVWSTTTPGSQRVQSLTGSASNFVTVANTVVELNWDVSGTPVITQTDANKSSAAAVFQIGAQFNEGSGAGGDLWLQSGGSTSGVPGAVWLQYGFENSIFGITGFGLGVAAGNTVNCATNTTAVLTAAQYNAPFVTLAATLTANTVVTWPECPTTSLYLVSVAQVTWNGHYLFFKSGGSNSEAVGEFGIFSNTAPQMVWVAIAPSGEGVTVQQGF